MPLFLATLWDVLTAAGGTVALTLIVAIALAIGAMTLFFAGSAVVVLERFARAAKRTRSLVGCAAFWSLLVGYAALHLRELGYGIFFVRSRLLGDGATPLEAAELLALPLREKVLAWGEAAVWSAVLVAIAVCAARLTLRWVRPLRLAQVTLLLMGLGAAIVLGGSGRVLHAAVPALVAAGGALLLRRRRARRSEIAAGPAESLLRVLAAALAVGVVLALLVPGPRVELAFWGSALLSGLFAAVVIGLVPIAAAGILDTRASAEWFIAVRYLVAKRRQTFISVITGICVIGIAAGVWLIITVLSVMNGFERTWRDEIIGNRAHFTLQSGLGPFEEYRSVLDTVLAVPGVVAASPYLDVEGMVRGDAGEIMAVRVRGVDPTRVGQVTDLR
ncbi:MAG TPA: ABC transporter permease, partial [Myxococcota bacterium]